MPEEVFIFDVRKVVEPTAYGSLLSFSGNCLHVQEKASRPYVRFCDALTAHLTTPAAPSMRHCISTRINDKDCWMPKLVATFTFPHQTIT